MINFDELQKNLDSQIELSGDDILIRNLLEMCSSLPKINEKVLKKIPSRIFVKVSSMLSIDNVEENHIINDMIEFEYLKENLSSIPQSTDEEEEIY
ncbi:hypothetical protein QEW_1018 [Clostridioides difficile CD160]|uniref:Uncharacterized protein n=1 Tax=Clostridioides difficile TaxID=1496 RepID=A0A386JBT4_CLODI|nr:hypothetical protein [Clostridioides difficile]AYD68644.1 hypothetical protein pHSJD-312_00021 [Clostridioides difficile]EQF26826.1 hypothetical protein QEW_1018 [Clostridioides difficile CD160]KPI55121.1 hypothetical protein KW94_03715 [Clostridioides difficile]HBG7285347.1 hypothetical protein [Clostridioides difficile]